jgi:hypothetical protein
MLFYLGVPCFLGIQTKKHFTHFALLLTAIRLLTSDEISKDDVLNASNLINCFIRQFKLFYGKENMSYKLHAHSHYPLQVLRYGGLNLNNCFAFEGIK